MNPRIYAILLTTLMTLPVFSKVVVYFNWRINQDYISKNLCVNKDKPVLKCKGKCQLMMKMNQTEPAKEMPSSNSFKDVSFSPFMLVNHTIYFHVFKPMINDTSHFHHHLNKFKGILHDKRLDNPPDMVA